MNKAILADVHPEDLVPFIKQCTDIIKNSGCFCWVNLSTAGWNVGDKSSEITIKDDRGKDYKVYTEKDISSWQLKDVLVPTQGSAYFYIFDNSVKHMEVIPLINMMRSLFNRANANNEAGPKYKDKDNPEDIKKLDALIVEDTTDDGVYYHINGMRIACIRLSGHPISWHKRRKFQEMQHSAKNVNTFFDPSTKEEMLVNIYDAIKYVKGKVSKNFQKKVEDMRFDELAGRINIFKEIGDKVYKYDETNYFGVENACFRYIRDLELAITNLDGDILSIGKMFKNTQTLKKIQELKDKRNLLQENLKWMKDNLPSYLADTVASSYAKSEETLEILSNKYGNSEYSDYLADDVDPIQIVKDIIAEWKDGNIPKEVKDDLVKYWSLRQNVGKIKKAKNQGIKRIRSISAQTLVSSIINEFDNILSSN